MYFTLYQLLHHPGETDQNRMTPRGVMHVHLSSHVGEEHTSESMGLSRSLPRLHVTMTNSHSSVMLAAVSLSLHPKYQSVVCTSCSVFCSPPVSISPQSWCYRPVMVCLSFFTMSWTWCFNQTTIFSLLHTTHVGQLMSF